MAAVRERLDRGQKELQLTQPLLPAQLATIETLKQLHVDHAALEREYRQEWVQLKLKYFRQLRPLYEQRQQALTSDQEAIPDFWLQCFKNHSTIAQTIEEHDEPIFKYLTNIDYEWIDEAEQTSFRIVMHFAENPFFTNATLTKQFELEEDPETYESVLSKSMGTVIDWRPGKNVTKKQCNRRQRNKRTGETRIIKDVLDNESFFHFFDSHEIPSDEKLEAMREQDIQELENILEVEYEIGCIIRDKIIPHAIGWYLGVEVDEDEESDDATEDEDEDDDEEDAGSEEGDDDASDDSEVNSEESEECRKRIDKK